MRIVYAFEVIGLCGGVKDALEHCNHLARRGHHVEVYVVVPVDYSWFPLDNSIKVTAFGSYEQLTIALSRFNGVRVATWWKTAESVAAAGGGAYFCQDVESSYAAGDPAEEKRILATYRLGLSNFTEAKWVHSKLHEMKVDSTWVGIGFNQEVFSPGDENDYANQVIWCERSHYLKGPKLRAEVLTKLAGKIRRIGYSPFEANPLSDEHLWRPSDSELAQVMRNSLCLLSTSTHEGFCMPAMEAMACGTPVVTTDADANMEFCHHGVNCLVGETADELAHHVLSLQDPALRRHLRKGALETASEYKWDAVIDRVERVLSQRWVGGR